MTIKEISEVTGLSKQTIINKIKEKYPAKIQHGKTTKLNQEESINVVRELKVEVSKNLTVESKNLTVDYVTKEDLKEFAKVIIQETLQSIIPMIRNESNPIMIEPSFYSLKAYMIKNKLPIPDKSGMIILGKEARKISEQTNQKTIKVPDEQYGEVNGYHISVLIKLFSED